MTKIKHTPGPWYAVGPWVEHPSDRRPDVCTCNPDAMGQPIPRAYKEQCANAKLIAGAPEMYAALRDIASDVDGDFGEEAAGARKPVKATDPAEDDADFEAGVLKPIDEAILKALPEAMARSPMGVTAAELSVITGATLRVVKTAITRLVRANRVEHIIAVVPPVVRPIDWRRPKADELPPLAAEIYKWLHRSMNETRAVKATLAGMELHFQTKVDAALAELVKRRMIAYRRSIVDDVITLEVL